MVYLVILFLLCSSAFFSASETALTSISNAHIHLLRKKRLPGAKVLRLLRLHPGKMITTILIGNNIANISASSLVTMVVIKQFAMFNLSYLTALVSAVMTIVVLIFCEVTPKNIALSKTDTMALIAAPIIYVISIILTPFIYIFNLLSTIMVKILKGNPLGKGSLITEEEVIALIDVGEEQGVFKEEETQMLKYVIEFGDKKVKEAMTPLKKVVSADISDNLDTVIDLIKSTPHSRIPVFKDFRSNIVGLMYAKDLLLIINEQNKLVKIKKYPQLLRKPFFVNQNEKISNILKVMKNKRAHLAIVQDENKTACGIITFEDIMEEIVGEIEDEHI